MKKACLLVICAFTLFVFGTDALAQCTPKPAQVGGDLVLRLPFRAGESYQVSQSYCGTFLGTPFPASTLTGAPSVHMINVAGELGHNVKVPLVRFRTEEEKYVEPEEQG